MGLIPAAGAAVQGAKAAAVFVAVGILAVEIDLQALRVPYLNMVDPPVSTLLNRMSMHVTIQKE